MKGWASRTEIKIKKIVFNTARSIIAWVRYLRSIEFYHSSLQIKIKLWAIELSIVVRTIRLFKTGYFIFRLKEKIYTKIDCNECDNLQSYFFSYRAFGLLNMLFAI